MKRLRVIFSFVIAFMVIFCIAVLMYGLIEAQFSIGYSMRRSEIILPFSLLGFLILLFMLFQLFSGASRCRAFGALKIGALIGLLWFLPQSHLIIQRLSGFVHSGLLAFVVYNVMEAAFGRFLLMLLYGQNKSPRQDLKRLEYHP